MSVTHETLLKDRGRRWHYSTIQAVAIGAQVTSPIFYCGDFALNAIGAVGAMTDLRSVGTAAWDFFVNVPTASAGAVIDLLGDTQASMATESVFFTWPAPLVAIYTPFTVAWYGARTSPFPFWRLRFTNGAVGQAATFRLAVAAGGPIG